MKLISIREYVLRFDKPIGFYADQLDYYEGQSNAMSYVISYANFLKQKLELWMFVPCKLVDGVWVVLEEPKDLTEENFEEVNPKIIEYEKSKYKVLFEGFEYEEWLGHSDDFDSSITNGIMHIFWYSLIEKKWNASKGMSTIEDLVKYNLELTPTAQKQIGI